MDYLSTMLEEASEIANVNLDLEPITVPDENGAGKPKVHKAGKSQSAIIKKTWKKPADKPKRPLSAYNIFFQHEREKIITSNPDASLDDVLFKIKNTPKPKKRRHRKSHGMIGFAQLARTIAEKWKGLEDSDKSIYESKAAIEKAKYREQLEAWSKAREEKAKEEEKKTPLELARVEAVFDDDEHSPSSLYDSIDKHHANKIGHLAQDTLSSLIMGGNGLRNPLAKMAHSGDVRDYLSMTQQTLEMARASLSLPLFANLPVNQAFPPGEGFGSVPATSSGAGEFVPYFGLQSTLEYGHQGLRSGNVHGENESMAQFLSAGELA